MLIRVVFLYYFLHVIATFKSSVAENTAIGDVNSACTKEELLRIRLAVSNLSNRVLEQKNEICEIKTQISAAGQTAADTNVQDTGTIDAGLVRKLQELLATQNTTLRRQAADIASLQQQLNESRNTRGTQVFYRWGRKDCPGNFSLVYTGYTGGSHYTHKGAAAEYTCMPSDPIWGPNKDKGSGAYAFMYGAEYEDPAIYKMKNTYQDVPCAVCEARHVTTVIMIPGRTECYSGWTEAYHGDLASGFHDHPAAAQYVCVDQDPQALDGGGDVDNNGKLLYTVRAKCGALRCPPYEDDKTLSCVVCVK